MKQHSFSKKKRLISNKQFKDVLACGCCLHDNLLMVYMAENKCGYSRFGVSVGKSYGNAVIRNRLKRLVREVFRQNQKRIPGNYDYLVLVRNKRKQLTFEQIKNSFLALATSAKKRCEEN
jgi:ribonuclease P protein component